MPEYLINPVAKPRMTRADKWRKRPATSKYWHFVDLCKLQRVEFPCFGAHVTFILPMPASWPKKKRATHNGKPHMSRPDLSNLLKALEDAIYQEDSVIYDVQITKRWGPEGKIVIEGG
jgi:Holliday junction resolvase RusA-like endonuclease